MITVTQHLPSPPSTSASLTLTLTAEERTHARGRYRAANGEEVQLMLTRGTVLRDGDWLATDDGTVVRVEAAVEPVLTVRAVDLHTLLRAAYHLGNRHVPLELKPNYLRLSPDPVLADMLRRLGLEVVEELAPFEPEPGAYGGHSHGHAHAHTNVYRHASR
jgi:urease accessory protein